MTAPFSLNSRTARSIPRPPGTSALAPVFLAALLLHACADDPTDPPLPPAASRILIEPDSVVLNTIGASATLTATVIDTEGDTIDDATVTWASAAPAIATVDTAGTVTAVHFGKTRISATSDSVTGHATVEVKRKFTDREILTMLYEATGGDDWNDNTNWLSNRPLSGWAGVETDEDGHVTEISLPWNNLSGNIPPELGYLPNLEVLAAYGNLLTGRIPPELGMLTKVRVFSLSNNLLEGAIPSELGDLVSVDSMYLSDNRLSGSIPPELGKLANLKLLWLFNNGLSGRIPPEMGNLENLRVLSISNNELEGALPPEIGDLDSLEWLSLHSNSLAGALPDELGKLGKLEVMWLGGNGITGPLPPELGNLGALKQLNLWQNQVNGTIPPELGRLTSLERLVLSSNQLSGSIPPTLGNLSKLAHLGLYGNNLSGTIPPELGNLSSLVDFWLSENRLSGSLPAELGKLSTVEEFGVQNNRLSGRIPPEFGRMSSLVKLALHNNNLSGTLPPELGELGNLSELRVHGNPALEGLLPRSFMNLGLTYLDIGGTDVCPQLDDVFQEWLRHVPRAYGLICPATLVERFALSELYAGTGGDSWSDNSGWDSDAPVDDWYGVTVGDSLVLRLDLPDNGLDGPLPPVIANLRALETFDLSDNLLQAGFPGAIVTMDALDTIRLSGNEDMEGPFPYRMIDMTELEALQYAETGLCASPSRTFQEWMDGLDIADGSTCQRADSVKLSLPVVYLTQAIQRPEGDLPLLSNREALLRVFLVGDRDNAFFEPEVFATFTRDGREVYRVVMPSQVDRLPTSADEGSLVQSYNALIPARHIVEGTELVVVADSAGIIPRAAGSRTRFPVTGSESLDVIEVPPMELTVVPVLEAGDPDSAVFDWTDGIDDDSRQVSQFRNSFPFSEFSATAREAYVTSLDLTESDGQWNLVLELERVRRDEEGTGYWYGAALSRNGYVRGVARLNGWVSIGKPEDAELAHEVGHNLDLRHAPCGGAGGTDPDFPYPTGKIGKWGYDSREGSVLSPRRIPDVMGYCYRGGQKSWLSDYYFEKVIDLREEKEGDDAQRRMAGAGPDGRMLVLWGGVLNGELRIEPVHPMHTAPMLPDEAGPYGLDGITSTGDIAFSLSFTPGEDVYGNRYFLFAIPIEDDWEDTLDRITLTGPEGEVTVDSGDRRGITVVTDPATGRGSGDPAGLGPGPAGRAGRHGRASSGDDKGNPGGGAAALTPDGGKPDHHDWSS